MLPKRKYPPFETLEKIKAWCDLQERAHSEVRRKLGTWGVFGDEAESIIAELITANFLSEERFARAFARGKSRMKGWGWRKIEQALKQKGVSTFGIKAANSELEEDEYICTLKRWIEKKRPTIKASSEFERNQKLIRFLISKGFEYNLVIEAIGNLD